MAIQIFSEFNDVTAGLSTKPDKSDALRAAMIKEAEAENRHVIRPCLVHGNNVFCITKEFLEDKQTYIEIENTDGLVTDLPGVRLTSTHGDCIPLYAFDPVRKVIGLAHAGWKGTASGIASKLINAMKISYGCDPAGIYTYIGPGIDKCHFEFGATDAERFFFDNHEWMRTYSFQKDSQGKLYLDLKRINKHFFELARVENIEVSSDCTYCLTDKYYSYRRSKDTDRMLAYLELNQIE